MKCFRLYSYFLFMCIVAGTASAEPAAESRGPRGTVQDTSGALIAGAQVIVTNQDGNTLAQRSTDNSGGFYFADLPPGSCSINITKEGFRETRQSVRIGSSPHSPLRIVLPVTAVAVYVVSQKLVNRLHFLVGHYDNQVHSINNTPQVAVSGAFTGGGAQADARQAQYHFDGTDIVTYTSGKHEIMFGIDVQDISRRGAMTGPTSSVRIPSPG